MSLTLARLGIIAGSFPIAAGGDFESIATVTVGSGGASSIEFTSIPSTYQHLQIRYVCRSARASNVRDDFFIRVGNGSIDTGNNYAYHNLMGSGSSAAAGALASTSRAYLYYISASSLAANIFGVGAIDILDYASTSKTKTIRSFTGVDGNGDTNLSVALNSGLWNSTSVIDTIRVYASNANLVQHSTAALYGVKAP